MEQLQYIIKDAQERLQRTPVAHQRDEWLELIMKCRKRLFERKRDGKNY